jgi:anti-sigma B factor antagonist
VIARKQARFRGTPPDGWSYITDAAVVAVGTSAVAVMATSGAGQLRLGQYTGADGGQVVSVAGELDIATAQQAYDYLSDVIDHGQTPVSVDLAGLTFCDASGLGVLARLAKRAKEVGRQLLLISPRPYLIKIMRITGLDGDFPELARPLVALGAPRPRVALAP